MPWSPMNVLNLRYEFVHLAADESIPVSELCRRYGISRKTGYKWLGRYQEGGETGFLDRSRRPLTTSEHIPVEIERAVVRLRTRHPAWGARKIRQTFERRSISPLPAMSTITRVLHRNGMIDPGARTPAGPFVRFEHPAPNALWQMDFKGWVRTLEGPCHPLTMLDDCSRFDLCLAALANERTAGVRWQLERVFERYGLPDTILADNGAPWGSDALHVHTPLTVWLMLLGINVIHIRPYHPQTQGKIERFHRTLKAEVIATRQWRSLEHCQAAFDKWRCVYNFERPHEALNGAVPADRYQPSLRPFPGAPAPPEYPSGAILRKVQQGGIISFHGREYRVGKAFRGHYVQLVETGEEGLFTAYFARTEIAEINIYR